MFKRQFEFENYLKILSPCQRKIFLKFRVSQHCLPIQILRYSNVDRSNRICEICDSRDVGDEFHYLFTCKNQYIIDYRMKYLKKYYYTRPNVYKMEQLFNIKSKNVLVNLTLFIKNIVTFLKT